MSTNTITMADLVLTKDKILNIKCNKCNDCGITKNYDYCVCVAGDTIKDIIIEDQDLTNDVLNYSADNNDYDINKLLDEHIKDNDEYIEYLNSISKFNEFVNDIIDYENLNSSVIDTNEGNKNDNDNDSDNDYDADSSDLNDSESSYENDNNEFKNKEYNDFMVKCNECDMCYTSDN